MKGELEDGAVPAAAPKRFLASFDIEDWFHAENVRGSLPTHDWDQLESRLEPNVHERELIAGAGYGGIERGQCDPSIRLDELQNPPNHGVAPFAFGVRWVHRKGMAESERFELSSHC